MFLLVFLTYRLGYYCLGWAPVRFVRWWMGEDRKRRRTVQEHPEWFR